MLQTTSRDGELSEDPSVSAAIRAIVDACAPRTIALFGSVARGEAHAGSDIDLPVVIDDEADWARSGRAALVAVARLEPKIDVTDTTRGPGRRQHGAGRHDHPPSTSRRTGALRSCRLTAQWTHRLCG